MKLHTPNQQNERDESGYKEVSVDLPDSLELAATVEAKRVGQTLEQWIAHVLTRALTKDSNGAISHG